MIRRYALRATAIALAATLPALMLSSPAAAEPGYGPSRVCGNSDYVSNSALPSNASVSTTFALNSVYLINGSLSQDLNVASYDQYMTSWFGFQVRDNYILVAARNDSAATRPVFGYLLDTYLC